MRVSNTDAGNALNVLEQYIGERVAVLKTPGSVKDLTEAVKMMDVLYRFKEALQKRVKTPVEEGYDILRFNVVPQCMDTMDVTSITVEGIGRVNVQDDVNVKVSDAEQLTGWLTENDLEDMIKTTVNAQTLAAFVRRRMKEGKELPTCLEVKPLVRAVITRSA